VFILHKGWVVKEWRCKWRCKWRCNWGRKWPSKWFVDDFYIKNYTCIDIFGLW